MTRPARSSSPRSTALATLLAVGIAGCAPSADAPVEEAVATERAEGPYGRWDMTFRPGEWEGAMWLELTEGQSPEGLFQGWVAHAVPVENVAVEGMAVSFDVPEGWLGTTIAGFEGTVMGDSIEGALIEADGSRLRVTGSRAPSLEREGQPEWGEPIDLLADGLDGWRTRDERDGWSIVDGILTNVAPSSDLITNGEFEDFRLQLDVRVPVDGNSGIYLRGRYEVQVMDDFGNDPFDRGMGGVYGQLTPEVHAGREPGQWQSYDITLVGREITVILNGQMIHDHAEIPGITGGALSSAEGTPGPVMLQGDHGPIEYRNIVLTPAVW